MINKDREIIKNLLSETEHHIKVMKLLGNQEGLKVAKDNLKKLIQINRTDVEVNQQLKNAMLKKSHAQYECDKEILKNIKLKKLIKEHNQH